MGYKCAVCGDRVSDDLKTFVQHTEGHITDLIKLKHPDWVQKDGLCHKCLEYYKKQIKGEST